jgi:hypothetical protein
MFPECFSYDVPEAALTYEWKLFLDDIFSYLNTQEIQKCNKKWRAYVPTDMGKLLIWIDVLFIDQVLVNAQITTIFGCILHHKLGKFLLQSFLEHNLNCAHYSGTLCLLGKVAASPLYLIYEKFQLTRLRGDI